MLKYQKKLDEFQIESLKDEALDPAFVEKATDFEGKIKTGVLTDEEISAIDDELCELFDKLHNFEDVDSQEVIQLQRQNTILQGKQKVDKENSIDGLKALLEEYKDFDEVTEIANEKLSILIVKQKEEQAKQKAEQSKKEAEEKARKAEEEKKQKEINEKLSIQERLLKKRIWDYKELRELGINPTGEDMVCHNVILRRRYLFQAYEVEGIAKS